MIAWISDESFGDVQPKISPGDKGLHCGTVTRYSDNSSLLCTDCMYNTIQCSAVNTENTIDNTGKCLNS